jgi:hypothetical protein
MFVVVGGGKLARRPFPPSDRDAWTPLGSDQCRLSVHRGWLYRVPNGGTILRTRASLPEPEWQTVGEIPPGATLGYLQDDRIFAIAGNKIIWRPTAPGPAEWRVEGEVVEVR